MTGYGPMSVQSVLALAAGLAEGLSAIHAAGVVHCDLKPSNVLLSQDGPRVIDFGISRAAEAVSVTGAGLVVGSPGFMSPEQATGQEIGPPSDIFSLGAVLTFAATGEGPFGQGSSPELAYRLVYSPPSLGQLPAQLRPLVERCLAKDPGERPTADEVLAEAGAVQPATGWPLGAFAQYIAPKPVAGTLPGQGPHVRPHLVAPLVAAADGGRSHGGRPGRVRRGQPRLPGQRGPALIRGAVRAEGHGAPPRPWSPVAAGCVRVPGRAVASRGPRPASDIIPAAVTVTSPTSPPAAVARRPRRLPRLSPRDRVGFPDRVGVPDAPPRPRRRARRRPPRLPPVPQITSVSTYRQGIWVYFDVHYADPGQDAQGFGFMGVDGSRWVEASYPFARPHRGIVGPDSVAYPLNLECGTAHQREAEIEVWIYETAAARSQPVVVHLAC